MTPSFPNIPVILGLVFLAAGFLGLFLILVLELTDSGFRSGEQLEQVTGLPSLGFVPKAKGSSWKPEESILNENKSAFSESLRTLIWSIRLESSKNPPKVILFTSAGTSEGKSTIATGLALSQALAGDRTLLIDADTRVPVLHKLLDQKRQPGLVDVLNGRISVEDAICEHSESGLSILYAGCTAPNASNLLASDEMRNLLNSTRNLYDLIIIDSPPVLACADARILCQRVDSTVFVVRWGKTRRNAVKLAVSQLLASGATIAGGLMSIVDLKKYSAYDYGDAGTYSGEYAKYNIG